MAVAEASTEEEAASTAAVDTAAFMVAAEASTVEVATAAGMVAAVAGMADRPHGTEATAAGMVVTAVGTVATMVAGAEVTATVVTAVDGVGDRAGASVSA